MEEDSCLVPSSLLRDFIRDFDKAMYELDGPLKIAWAHGVNYKGPNLKPYLDKFKEIIIDSE